MLVGLLVSPPISTGEAVIIKTEEQSSSEDNELGTGEIDPAFTILNIVVSELSIPI